MCDGVSWSSGKRPAEFTAPIKIAKSMGGSPEQEQRVTDKPPYQAVLNPPATLAWRKANVNRLMLPPRCYKMDEPSSWVLLSLTVGQIRSNSTKIHGA